MAILGKGAGILTIGAAATVSDAMDVAGDQNLSIYIPTAWTAATLTMQIQREGNATDWFTVCDLDGPVVLPSDAGRVVLLPGSTLIPNAARRLRVVSSVAQASSRAIIVERRSF